MVGYDAVATAMAFGFRDLQNWKKKKPRQLPTVHIMQIWKQVGTGEADGTIPPINNIHDGSDPHHGDQMVSQMLRL